MTARGYGRKRAAFSLVELMVVIAIMLLLAAFTVPAFNSLTMGSNLNRAGQLVADQISSARQTAVTRNRETQVWFYESAGGMNPGWRGMQVWRVDQTASGVTNVPASRVFLFPEGVGIEPLESPLLTADASISGSFTLPSLGTVNYAGFRFRASGGTDVSVNATNNYVTLRQAWGAGSNYYTVQVNPITGKASVFRP